jgi:hypothetical protein
MEAPASAASTAAFAISSGVTGKNGDMEGVWTEPVIAHVSMTLFKGVLAYKIFPASAFLGNIAQLSSGWAVAVQGDRLSSLR